MTDPFIVKLVLSFIVGSVWITLLSIFSEKFGTKIGGAGRAALQIFRNYLEVKDGNGGFFNNLERLTILFNAQPDWKTWDVDPIAVIAKALNMYGGTDIFSKPLTANARAGTKDGMIHKTGYALSISQQLHGIMTEYANQFSKKHPDKSLNKIDY
jgi:hypothetical protein